MNHLYFINLGNQSIIQCNLEGREVKQVVNPNITQPEALTVYKDLLYVSTEEKIVSIDKTSFGDIKQLRDATPNVNALMLYDKIQRNLSKFATL